MLNASCGEHYTTDAGIGHPHWVLDLVATPNPAALREHVGEALDIALCIGMTAE